MSIITFTSDFGFIDPYIAAVKTKIYTIQSDITIVDISHGIDKFNIAQAAYVLRTVYADFPEDTVHLVAVDAMTENGQYIIARIHEQYFVGADNGLLSLICEQDATRIVRISYEGSATFAAKKILAPAAAQLATGTAMENLGEEIPAMEIKLPRMLKATKKQITGHVIYVDSYGNLITNIDRYTYETLSEDKAVTFIFGRERMHRLQQGYTDVEYGDCFLLFNEQNLLEIGIRQGNAHQLLGIHYDSPVQIIFEEK